MSSGNELASFQERLKEAMALRGKKAADLVKETTLSKQQMSQYVNGKFIAKANAMDELAQALNVDEKWLRGYNVSMERLRHSSLGDLKTVALPVLGEIACGAPLLTYERGEIYYANLAVSGEVQPDFCLRAKGDSMIGARIHDGDMVLIREQERVENGEIAAVIIEDEATLKRVYYDEENDEISLYPENPDYRPMHFRKDDLNKIRILGKAISVHSNL